MLGWAGLYIMSYFLLAAAGRGIGIGFTLFILSSPAMPVCMCTGEWMGGGGWLN